MSFKDTPGPVTGTKHHGHTRRVGTRVWRSPTYYTWESMRARCMRDTHPRYDNYGGRGITICSAWDTFAGFLADMGERPDGHTLSRTDHDGNYEPANCTWELAGTH